MASGKPNNSSPSHNTKLHARYSHRSRRLYQSDDLSLPFIPVRRRGLPSEATAAA